MQPSLALINKNMTFAMVDCNSFYCSCERVFDPSLNNKPIIVLSNNDGCAISRTDEAKELGIPMGAVYFQIKDLIKKYDIKVFSSNYTLYGDMSARVMEILSSFSPEIEIYSIDEAFLDLTGMTQQDLVQYALDIKSTVLQYTGLPTCVGIAPTKVLSKIANHLAKKDKVKTQGVFDLRDPSRRDTLLKSFPVEDIWGIGRKSAKKLYSHKIKTAYELQQSDPEFIRKILTISGKKICEELRGLSCIELTEVAEESHQIMSSRSFGRSVSQITDIKESIANHITSCAEKLRAKNLLCQSLTVYIHTNPFGSTPQYYKSAHREFLTATMSTSKLIENGSLLLDSIFKDGYQYKKCGVILGNLIKKDFLQTDFFHSFDSKKQEILMKTLDDINKSHGRGTLKFAACGIDHFWKMLSEMKSPRYTTNWNELKKI